MQKSQAVCFACRRQLAVVSSSSSRSRSSHLYQWQERASSKSAWSGHERNETSSAHDFIPSLDELDAADPSNQRSNDGRKGAPSSGTSPEGRFHVPQGKRIKRHDYNQLKNLDMFRHAVQHHNRQDGPVTKQRDRFPDEVDFFNSLERLRPMMNDESLDRCFHFFLDKVWSKVSYRSSSLLKNRGIILMQRVAEEKSKDMYNDKWPSMAQITQITQEMGSLRPIDLSGMIIALIESIIASSSLRADYTSDEAHQKALTRKQELLEDLVDTWIIFSRNRLNPDISSLSPSQEAQFRLPEIHRIKLQMFAKQGDLSAALGLVLPNSLPSSNSNVHAAALATFVLLVDSSHSNPSIRRKAKPFLVSIGRVLAAFQTKNPSLEKIFQPFPQTLWYVMRSWSSLITKLHQLIPSPVSVTHELEDRIINGSFGEAVALDPRHFQKRLSSALLMGDVGSVEAVWVQYWGEGDVPDERRALEMRRHPKLFDSFITVFTALRRPQRALDVWNAMTRIGIGVTLETWTAMIEGFRKAKNPVGLEGVWKKLVASGMQLDHKAWRTRVSGLMDCGEPQAGLQALKELAEQSKQRGGVSLTIESVNAAVAGLIRLNAMTAAMEVLQWASEYGVNPDIFTYNILLRPLLQSGKTAQVESILQLMRAQGIQPDATTFTALLDGFIVSSRNKTPDERMSMMREFMDNMEKAGVNVNIDTLGRMIHLLIRDGQQTIHHTKGVVGAILEYAEKKSLRLSRHIYTILVEYYFSKNPPDVDAVNELIMDPKGLILGATGDLDRVFWERVIKGFASVGDGDRAFGLFQQINSLGTALTLDCLETLLRCLVSQDKMLEARTLAMTVAKDRRNSEQQRQIEGPHRFWRHRFWGLAHDLKLLSPNEWGPPSQE